MDLAAAKEAASRLRNYLLTVRDLDITRPDHTFAFRGVTFRTATLLAADDIEDVARRLGVSIYALDYSMKETD